MLRLSILAAAIVVLVAGAAMLHSGPSAPTASVSISYRSLPDDVIVVIQADVQALVEAEVFRSLSDRFGENPLSDNAKYREFVEATGFRLETDLKSVTIGMGGNLADDSPPFYVLVDGNFDRKKVDAYLLNSGEYEREELDGMAAYVPNGEADSQEISATLAWLDDDTLVASSSPDFGKLVRSIDGRAPNVADSVLGRLLTGADGQIQLAMILPEAEEPEQDDASPPSMVRGIVESVRNSPLARLDSILVTLDAGSGLDLTVQAEADTPESSTAVYEMLNGYLAMGRMMAAENPQLGVVLDHFELERNESVVKLGVSMTGDEIRAAIEESQPEAIAVKPTGS